MESSTTQRKTFLLGVGCQKGGTTWLFDYLAKSDAVNMGPVKEYHVFDLLDLGTGRKRLERLARKGNNPKKGEPVKDAVRLRLKLINDPDSYFDFFADLLSRPGVLLTADITPSYAALSPDRFRSIKEGFEERGIGVKVAFLMRDPVERVWSSVRMSLRDEAEKKSSAGTSNRTEEELVLERHGGINHQIRTNYHHTMENLEKVFDRSDIFYGFYERLFTDSSVRELCNFLGIPYRPADFSERSNASPKTGPLSDDAAREIARSYRDVYTDARKRFGDDFITEIWPSARL